MVTTSLNTSGKLIKFISFPQYLINCVSECILQLKDCADRHPMGDATHASSVSMSVGHLDVPNGSHPMTTTNMVPPSDGEGAQTIPQKYNVSTVANNTPDVDGNGVISPHSMSCPPSFNESYNFGSPQSGSSPHVIKSDFGGVRGRVLASMHVTNGREGERNGVEPVQINDEGGRRVGSSFSPKNGTEPETEWVEQDEPGVYITLTSLPGGGRVLKRVRFRYLIKFLIPFPFVFFFLVNICTPTSHFLLSNVSVHSMQVRYL